MKTARNSQFTSDNTDVDGYFVAGTARAGEFGQGDDCACVVCGSPLRHVFVTNHGLMGGDCLATITGDNSSRAILRRLKRFEGCPVKVTVTRGANRVQIRVRQLGRSGIHEAFAVTSPVVATVIGWAETTAEVTLRVKDEHNAA